MFVGLGLIIHVLAWLVGFWDLKLLSAEEGFPLRDLLNILLCFFWSIRIFVVCVLLFFFFWFCLLVVLLIFVHSIPNVGVFTFCH